LNAKKSCRDDCQIELLWQSLGTASGHDLDFSFLLLLLLLLFCFFLVLLFWNSLRKERKTTAREREGGDK
jgi:Ca2+/Na+ antiporter